MHTNLYDFTEFDAWAEGHPERIRFVDAAKVVLNDGMDPEEFAKVIEWVYNLTPREWEQFLREVEQNKLNA
ncbi:MAG: hypothetical protein Q8S24_00005 [Eubacteriales bacterium]|nr:hypothetical protein [Eubacteriales bacterium]